MSPTVFSEKGYLFFLSSREEERIHVHVISGDGEAKFWLEPEIDLAKNYNMSSKQLNEVESIIEDHFDELISAWKEHFSS